MKDTKIIRTKDKMNKKREIKKSGDHFPNCIGLAKHNLPSQELTEMTNLGLAQRLRSNKCLPMLPLAIGPVPG